MSNYHSNKKVASGGSRGGFSTWMVQWVTAKEVWRTSEDVNQNYKLPHLIFLTLYISEQNT